MKLEYWQRTKLALDNTKLLHHWIQKSQLNMYANRLIIPFWMISAMVCMPNKSSVFQLKYVYSSILHYFLYTNVFGLRNKKNQLVTFRTAIANRTTKYCWSTANNKTANTATVEPWISAIDESWKHWNTWKELSRISNSASCHSTTSSIALCTKLSSWPSTPANKWTWSRL